jgi:hypothetical protein
VPQLPGRPGSRKLLPRRSRPPSAACSYGSRSVAVAGKEPYRTRLGRDVHHGSIQTVVLARLL